MEVGQFGLVYPANVAFGPQGLGRGGRNQQSAPTQQAVPATQGSQTGGAAQRPQQAVRTQQPQPSATTTALQQVNQDLDELTGKLDTLIGALTKFIDDRKQPAPPPFNPEQPQNPPNPQITQTPGGQVVADPNQVTPQQMSGNQSPGNQSPGNQSPRNQSPGNQGNGNQAPGGQTPGTGATPAVEVGQDGDININIFINVEPPAGGKDGKDGANGANGSNGSNGAGAGQAPKPNEPVKVEIVEPPPPPPPPPGPTSVLTSDFGSITVNGKQTFLGTVFGIFFDPPKAADYIAGVLNTNPDNGGITASITSEGRVVLTSKSGGAVTINDIQSESDGDPINNALLGFTKGQTANGSLTGEVVSLFDPSKIDVSDPNRPPILRGT